LNRFVLDTNIVSAMMCHDAKVLECARAHKPRDLILISPVAAEIGYGIARLGQRTRRRRLLLREFQQLREVLGWSDWNEQAAFAFGQIKTQLEKGGQVLEDWDIAIAATGHALQATIVTRDRKHFCRVRDLKVETW